MSDFIGNMLNNMDEDQAKAMLQNIDPAQVHQAVAWLGDEYVAPQLDEIRQRAQVDDNPMEVRAYYESLDENEQQSAFEGAVNDLVATFIECRARPQTGLPKMKMKLRDPWTMEALLLIFENEEHIDAEYSQTLKEYAAENVRYIGACALPEMYDDAEVREVKDSLGLDQGQQP